jgi:hypothetical protein
MFYKKRPVTIEAQQLTPTSFIDVFKWVYSYIGPIDGDFGVAMEDDYLLIGTLEGVMKASMGDYIIRGVDGEFYPCKPHIFEETYSASE